MIFPQYFFAAGALLTVAMQIAASVILLRERSISSYLMLGGAIIYVLAVIGAFGSAYLSLSAFGNKPEGMFQYQTVLAALRLLGNLAFFTGLLLHALRRQAIAGRVTELETIIAARDAG